MSRFRFELAGPADEADLRAVLAATPMAGRIRVGFRREPDYFAGAVVEGRFRQVVACRDTETGRIIGFGTRSVMDRYVNGDPLAVGYLGGLRVLPAYRNQGLVARGFAFFRRQHADGRAPLYLTTIALGNKKAEGTLLGGRAGLPKYHPAGRYHTLALSPPGVRQPRRPAAPRLEVRRATAGDTEAVLAFLGREGPRRQFLPAYDERDLFRPDGLLAGLRPEDLWLAWRGGQLVGTLGAWDQHAYKQAVVDGYEGAIGWLRPAYNAWARLTGGAPLPAPGEPLRYCIAALPVVTGNDLEVFTSLLAAGRSARPEGYLMLGLHESDPLWEVARRFGGTDYVTGMYLACWDDGEPLRRSLDGRPPYLEAGCL